ncbi:PREDICTED: spermatid nuclear transition protein 4-like [Condylura cristata]|uniref:spermatid nuclear transition protein 4-like n=1 Tax=Condylura cristata TaxID=143302 RepID=UPI00064362EB|nr:PREDICTED: spermatid nuclear transition protein 4-like [Condylura cristata]
MARITKKSPEPTLDMEQPTSSSKQNKKAKTSCQPRSKAMKTSMKVKPPLRRNLHKKPSEKRVNTVRNVGKTRRQTVFGHYRKLNEKLNQDEAEEEQGSVKTSTSSEQLRRQ